MPKRPTQRRRFRRALALGVLRLARLASTISSALSRFAAWVDPSLRAQEPPDDSGPGPETLAAQRLIAEITLRNALHRALNRYSPRQPPAQA